MENSKKALQNFRDQFINSIIDQNSSAKEHEPVFYEKVETSNLIKVLDNYYEVIQDLEGDHSAILNLISRESSIYKYLNTSKQKLKQSLFESKYGSSPHENQDQLDQESAEEAEIQYEELRNKFEEDIIELDSIIE